MQSCLVVVLILGCTVQGSPQPGPGCGEDRLTGEPRQEGDTWYDGCNNCRCLANGRPGCTKRLCQGEGTCGGRQRWEEKSGSEVRVCHCAQGTPACSPLTLNTPTSNSCMGNDGREWQVGDRWKEFCNTCLCTETGVAACTLQPCQVEPPRSGLSGKEVTDLLLQGSGPGSRVNFPTEESARRTGVCQDGAGRERSAGQVWREECNVCRCLARGTTCTKKICPRTDTDLADQTKEAASLLQEVSLGDRDVSQCNQEGVTRCRAVRIHSGLTQLRAGTILDFLPGSGITVELRRDPEVTTSGGLALALSLADGGDATVVVGQSGAVYGSINPGTGSVLYVLESCGKDCTVLLERDRSFFNQFKD